MLRQEFRESHHGRSNVGLQFCRGANICCLSLFILFTVVPWLLTVHIDLSVLTTSDLWHGCAAVFVVIILVAFYTVELAGRRLSVTLEWILTIGLIVGVTLWSLRIIANTPPIELVIIVGSVLVSMLVLIAIGANTSSDSFVIYASFVAIWFLVFLVNAFVIMFLFIVMDNRSLAVYVLALMLYPLIISLVVFEGILISSTEVCTNILSRECVRPARKLYFQFVLVVLLTLLVWRELQNIETV